MRNIINSTICLIIFILNSCGDNTDRQKFVELGSYKLDSTAVNDNEEIRLIYCSSGGEEGVKLDFFIQFVAIKINSNDTINIMTNHNINIAPSDGDKIFVYKKVFNKDYSDVIRLKDGIGKAAKGIKSPEISVNMPMVITDENYKDIGKNNYPTVFGDIQLK
jgi:hypothetical protein